MLPPVAALWIAIRILVEFVFPFSFFPKASVANLLEFPPFIPFGKNSAIFFARPGLQNLKINPSRNSIRACRTRSIPNVPSSPACRCAAGIPNNRNNMDGVLRFVPVWRIGEGKIGIASRQSDSPKNLDFTVYGADKRVFRLVVAWFCENIAKIPLQWIVSVSSWVATGKAWFPQASQPGNCLLANSSILL